MVDGVAKYPWWVLKTGSPPLRFVIGCQLVIRNEIVIYFLHRCKKSYKRFRDDDPLVNEKWI